MTRDEALRLKMKPIIMSTEDVQEILDGRKTMKRAVINPQPTYWNDGECVYNKDSIVGPELYNPIRVDKDGEQYPGKEVYGIYSDDGEYGCKAPYKPGDVLYVQEVWGVGCRPDCSCGWVDGIEYKVDCEYLDEWDSLPLYHANKEELLELFESDDIGGWRSASTMPQEAARLFLRVKDVRVERVQDISPEDCESEGYFEAEPVEPRPRSWFSAVWDARNAKRGYGWDTNPFCWVIEFKRVENGAES